MNKKRKQKLIIISVMLLGLAIALALILSALKDNINLFYTPTEALNSQAPKGSILRLGGLVRKGSVVHGTDQLNVDFVITDFNQDITVSYQGVLPNLFREGQGVVVEGRLDENQHFNADTVLAKHDENYMPPQIAKALEQYKPSGKGKQNP